MSEIPIEEIASFMMLEKIDDFEEAVLTYRRRKELPSTAFCGPNRSYPVHDAAHVRNALARLSQFGGRLKQAVRARILACIKRRAKRFGVEVSETSEGKLALAKFDTELPEETRKQYLLEVEETLSYYHPELFGEKEESEK